MDAATGVRMGWLLRVNRLLGADPELATASRFASALRAGTGGGAGGAASPARVSQWETGRARVGHATVRRYERLLGLPVNRLAAMAGIIPGERPPARVPDPADPHVLADTAALLDRALGGDRMTGPAWDDLTASLAARPDVLIHPREGWEMLTHRLLVEMVVTDGLPWIQRNTALGRLLRHRSGAPGAIAACGSFAADPAHQVFVEPLAGLHVTRHPDASRLVLAQLARPASGRALSGALMAAGRKVAQRQFTPGELAVLVRLVGDVAADASVPVEVHHLVPVLLARLPDGPAVERLRRLSAAGAVGRHVLGSGRTHATATTAAVVERVVLRAVADAVRETPGPDPVLAALVEEMLFDPDPVTRLNAGFLVAATPHRGPVAAAVASEIPDALRGDAPRAVALLTSLGALGTCPDRGLLERLVLDPAAGPTVSEAAARALGLVGSRPDVAFWPSALHRHLDGWRRTGSTTTLTTLRRLVQALGVADERPVLAALAAAPGVPGEIRSAAAWWSTVDAATRSAA